MITLPKNIHREFADYYAKIKSGELRTMIPLLSLLRINGQPFTLERHFMFAPMFNTVQAPQTIFCIARQLGKSYSLCASSILRSILVPGYHQLLLQPQADQIQRLNASVYQPLLKGMPLIRYFMPSVETNKLALKTFNNGSLAYLDYCGAGGQTEPSRLRGLSGLAHIGLDETVWENEPIYIIDKHLGTLKKVPIKAVRGGDFILSCNFCDGEATISVVTKDASFHGYRNYFKVTTRSGRSVTCTADHTLPTNRGPMRIGDIIDDLYSRTSGCNRDVRGAGKCCDGEHAGGRLFSGQREGDKRCALESRTRTGGLRGSQVRSLTRVRYASTISETESRLRGLLGGPVPEGAPDISLYVHPDAARGLREENSHCGILERDYTPDCFGLVVHGRRKQGQGSQLCSHLHEWFQRGGSEPALQLVEDSVGCGVQAMSCETQQYRQLQPYNRNTERWLCSANGADHTLCTGMYGIQGQGEDKRMPELRKGVHGTQSVGLLLPGMSGDISEELSARALYPVSSGTPGGDSCACSKIQRSTQRGASRKRSCVSCQYDRGTEGTQGCAAGCMAAGKQGSYQRGSQGLSSSHEGRPGVRGKTESGACSVLSAQGRRSGTSCPYARTSEGCQTEAGDQGTQSGISAQTQGYEDHTESARGGAAQCMEALSCRTAEDTNGRRETAVLSDLSAGASGMPSGSDQCGSYGCEDLCGNAESAGVFFLDPIVNIEYVGVLPGYDIEVEGTHNYVLASGILSKNCQDIPYEYLPIIMEVCSASIHWGFATYTGTPKTTDTTLALLFAKSSQAEWVVRCDACNHFNIPNPEHDLLKMIGKHGPVCAKCGRPIHPETGGYVHAFPDRMCTFPGFHYNQCCHPLHYINDTKWSKILTKVSDYQELALYNEVFGWPYDAATSPLTLSDLINAEFDAVDTKGDIVEITKPSDIRKVRHNYSYITVGCDWSGGGMLSDSYTSFAVLGLQKDGQTIDVLYGERIKKGLTPTQEADILMSWIRGAEANAFAFDNGGAGFVRTEIMKHQGLMDIPGLIVCPIQYSGPRGGDIMTLSKATREYDYSYFNLEKSRSLAMCIAAIKQRRIRFPRFKHDDPDAYVRDFLALREDPRITRSNDTVIIIIKRSGVPDDFAHAVNFGCNQIYDSHGAILQIGKKYDTTALTLDENRNPIMDDDVFGPRSDFQRFQDACNMNCAIVEPDYDDFY